MQHISDDDRHMSDRAKPAKQEQILLVACGALAREILALQDLNNWDHMTLQCLPANLHNAPQKIPEAVRETVERERDAYDRIFVVYADCGTGGLLQAMCDRLGVEMIPGPHCYSFYEGNEVFQKRADEEFASFFLTDFLVRQFDAFVWQPLGLDRHPDLRDMYFGHYEKLVYQAQIKDTELVDKAKECAARLGLEFEYRFTGYGDLATTLDAIAKPRAI